MPPRKPRQPKVRPPAPDAIDAPWRLFLAVCLPQDVQHLVAEEIATFEAEGWPVRWVQPETSHLTLHFLGETERERAELIRLALPDVVAAHTPFDLRTAALGVFPNFRRPRVLWLGLHGPVHRLQTLHQDIGRALQGLGFSIGDEPYHPHITLGRVRNDDGDFPAGWSREREPVSAPQGRAPRIAVCAPGEASDEELVLAGAVGRLVAERGCTLVCGGLGGAMAAV